ncbi:MAG TPA: hypothetical protein VMS17_29075, partial [Gemmataceae bacterium]|nr:hypothetical protein [Gemmataceae bacterium]
MVLRPAALGAERIPEQCLILATCRDEKQQVELLDRFQREGSECAGRCWRGGGGDDGKRPTRSRP